MEDYKDELEKYESFKSEQMECKGLEVLTVEEENEVKFLFFEKQC